MTFETEWCMEPEVADAPTLSTESWRDLRGELAEQYALARGQSPSRARTFAARALGELRYGSIPAAFLRFLGQDRMGG